MSPETLTTIKELATGGFATFLIALLVAGKYRVWVYGHYLDEVIKNKDAQIAREQQETERWRALALGARELTDRSLAVAARVVSQAQQ